MDLRPNEMFTEHYTWQGGEWQGASMAGGMHGREASVCVSDTTRYGQ